MAYFVLSEKAESLLQELIVDKDADDVFVERLRDYLENLAESPSSMTEVADGNHFIYSPPPEIIWNLPASYAELRPT